MINSVVLGGYLTRDVELRYSDSGVCVARIGLCVNRRHKKDGEWLEKPVFIDITMFGRRAEAFEKYHHKGDYACFNSCELDFDEWEKDGVRRSKLSVIANSWTFVGGGGGSEDPLA